MRLKENYTRFIGTAFVLTLAVLILFQVYIFREPARIAGVEAQDKSIAVSAGQALFKTNCTLCHGDNGEGDIGPALNDKTFLKNTADDTIFSIISSGIPGTQMPAWNQSHGGPLTDQNVTQLVAFVRAWQNTAPDRSAQPIKGDASRGQQIFTNVCFVCHGDNGTGSDRAPAISDAQHVSQFDNAWYQTTIEQGRPSKGMPTWGTVLSPQQIADLLALVDTWRQSPPVPAVTSAPTLTPTTNVTATATPTATVEVAQPSNPGGPGPALTLTGDAKAGEQIFTTDCQKCHGPQGIGNVANPGSTDGTVPPLNPIDPTLTDANPKTFAYNVDLFIEHGSTPDGSNPQLKMPAWGDQKKLAPQQIADVIAYVMSLNRVAPITPTVPITPTETPTIAPTATITPTAATTEAIQIARPSNPGGPGAAINLSGDAKAGEQIFTTDCQKCHAPQGVGNVANPGSTDGTVPALNPIDSTIADSDSRVFAYNVDLFVEHGSTPDGQNPQLVMPAWGDQKKLTSQQIANVIAYVLSLNPVTTTTTITPTEPPAAPSNAGGPGAALALTGDPASGESIFTTNCQKCHGPQGSGNVANPGSTDGTVPPLNPIDPTLANVDLQIFAYNIDLFLEHGSTPDGKNPQLVMPAWGDQRKLTSQQIADVIAYVMSLNKP